VERFGPSHDEELTAELLHQASADLRPKHIDEEVRAPNICIRVASLALLAFAGTLDNDTRALSIARSKGEDAAVQCAQRIGRCGGVAAVRRRQ